MPSSSASGWQQAGEGGRGARGVPGMLSHESMPDAPLVPQPIVLGIMGILLGLRGSCWGLG